MSLADEDIVRTSSDCLLFNEFFAALVILVSIVYYAAIKCALMAMGAVLMSPPKPHPIYSMDELDSPEDDTLGDDSRSCSEGCQGEPNSMSTHVESDTGLEQSSSNSDLQGAEPRPLTPSEIELEEIETGQGEEIEIHPAATPRRHLEPMFDEGAAEDMPVGKDPDEDLQPMHSTPKDERFNAVKIWTNIYGLSVGIYCLVYSLLMPSELSAFVFCTAALLASLQEFLVPCLRAYVQDEDGYYEVGGRGGRCVQG